MSDSKKSPADKSEKKKAAATKAPQRVGAPGKNGVVKATILRTPSFAIPSECSQCKSGDQIRKWTGVVGEQTSTSSTRGKSVTDRGAFKSDYVTTSHSQTTTSSKLVSRYPYPKKPTTYLWFTYLLSIIGLYIGCTSNAAFLYGSIPLAGLAIALSASRSRKQRIQDKLQAHLNEVAKYENTWYCARCDLLFSVPK